MKFWLFAPLLMVGFVSSAQAGPTPACDAPVLTCANGLCRLDVSFPAADVCAVRIDDPFIAKQNRDDKTRNASRISEKTAVRLRIIHPNLLRYAVQVDTKETVVESYVYLEKLWKQILGLGPLAGIAAPAGMETPPREQAFINAVNAWRDGLDREGMSLL